MKGLIRNNFYAALASAKWMAAAFLVIGIITGILDNKTYLIVFSLFCMVAFSVNSMACLRKDGASKWNKYRLTAPLRRKDIVRSYYLCQPVWILAGMLLSGMSMGISFLMNGYLFDLKTDVLNIFTIGIALSLMTGAIFYPLFYLAGEERNEAVLGISLISSVGILAGMVYLINLAFGSAGDLLHVLLSAAIILGAAVLLFVVSCFAAAAVFLKKEY